MPCDKKIHIVREKWERERKRREEEEQRRRREAVPAPDWPTKLPVPKPAEVPATGGTNGKPVGN